jgi:hypothetical protein
MTRREWLELSAVAAAPALASASATQVDFKWAPVRWQTAYCFPDDPHKSLVDDRGRLLYGNPGRVSADFFPTIIEFSLSGMERERITGQTLEAPGVPIVHTFLEKSGGKCELIAFATNRAGEGRVDNVVLKAQGVRDGQRAVPIVTVASRGNVVANGNTATLDGLTLLVANRPLQVRDLGNGWRISLPLEPVGGDVLFRFPQGGRAVDAPEPAPLLEEARTYWKTWKAFGGNVQWELPRPYSDFLVACARNILQAREMRKGRLTFQVGPTCYRGLWVVDGNFILEAARYLGYDREAREGLQTTWTYQRPDGALDAGGGPEHYKDSAIAMFTTVRQCELGQDWSDFRDFLPRMERAAAFLKSMRDKARQEGSPAGRHGLLAIGFADGGFSKGNEFTNTLWALAGLKAATEVASGGMASAATFYHELRQAFEVAVREEMVKHPAGFEYLPMVMRDDPSWQRDDWNQPRPQAAQWALSQAIYPGLVFAPDHPVVRGHLALMKACTREDIPAETGWIPHEGAWTYNAGFAAHASLWAGEHESAKRTFIGFLDHASPTYCWREEQPLRGSLLADYVGDMPHNWASAECVLFLRHMLLLEDGSTVRLLEGLDAPDLAPKQRFRLSQTPTRFGRVDLDLAPERKSWRLRFRRGSGPTPAKLLLPATLAGMKLSRIDGAAAKPSGRSVTVDPSAASWSAVWGG